MYPSVCLQERPVHELPCGHPQNSKTLDPVALLDMYLLLLPQENSLSKRSRVHRMQLHIAGQLSMKNRPYGSIVALYATRQLVHGDVKLFVSWLAYTKSPIHFYCHDNPLTRIVTEVDEGFASVL